MTSPEVLDHSATLIATSVRCYLARLRCESGKRSGSGDAGTNCEELASDNTKSHSEDESSESDHVSIDLENEIALELMMSMNRPTIVSSDNSEVEVISNEVYALDNLSDIISSKDAPSKNKSGEDKSSGIFDNESLDTDMERNLNIDTVSLHISSDYYGGVPRHLVPESIQIKVPSKGWLCQHQTDGYEFDNINTGDEEAKVKEIGIQVKVLQREKDFLLTQNQIQAKKLLMQSNRISELTKEVQVLKESHNKSLVSDKVALEASTSVQEEDHDTSILALEVQELAENQDCILQLIMAGVIVWLVFFKTV